MTDTDTHTHNDKSKIVPVHIRFCGAWFPSQVTELKAHLLYTFGEEAIQFTEEPVEVLKGEKKPYELTVNGELVYSHLTPIDEERGPILFSKNKWWGEPVPKHLERVEESIRYHL